MAHRGRLVVLLLCGAAAACRSGAGDSDAARREARAVTSDNAQPSAVPSAAGPGVPAAVPAPAEPDPETAAAERLAGLLRYFCAGVRTGEDLIGYLAPGAVEAGGRTLPGGTAFVIRGEAVVSLYTAVPTLGVVWWPRRSEAEPVDELHVRPEVPGIGYAAFRDKLALGAGTLGEQGHPLADLPHRHRYGCGEDRELNLVLSEVAWKGSAVGMLGELVLTRPPAGRLLGVAGRTGVEQCADDPAGESTWTALRPAVGLTPIVAEPATAAALDALRGRPVVVRGRPLAERPADLPSQRPGTCLPMQMRSDWVWTPDGMRYLRPDRADLPAFGADGVDALETPTAERDGDELALRFVNPLDVPLEIVVLRLHYEGCYGKPGTAERSQLTDRLEPGARAEARFPAVVTESDGHPYAASTLQVFADAPDVWFDLDVPLGSLAAGRVECPDQR